MAKVTKIINDKLPQKNETRLSELMKKYSHTFECNFTSPIFKKNYFKIDWIDNLITETFTTIAATLLDKKPKFYWTLLEETPTLPNAHSQYILSTLMCKV